MNQLHWFFAAIAATIVITVWAARRSTGAASLYAADGRITASQNGLAISGDLLSAGTILGNVGIFFGAGLDAGPYMMGPLVGLILTRLLIAGPLRRLGRFTLGDVVTSRLGGLRVRLIIGLCAVVISMFYLVAQMVGAGALISIIFGLDFELSVVLVGGLMALYVALGGMLAATWVQIVKAVLLLGMILALSILALAEAGGPAELFALAAANAGSDRPFSFGGLNLGLLGSTSLVLTLAVGMMGMPHILIRFFTVPDEATAERSLAIASTIIGLCFAGVLIVIGPAALAFVGAQDGLVDAAGQVAGGPNMVTMHLSRLLGGDMLFGLMSAVVFSTILAVVAGLTISTASAISHDIVAGTLLRRSLSERAEIRLFRAAALLTSAVAIGLAILFQHENITVLIVMAQTVAASTTFPILLLAIYWSGLTARGAFAAGLFGLVASLLAMAGGPAVWVKALGHAQPIIPTDYPAMAIMPASLLLAWLFSRRHRALPAEMKAGH